MSMFFVRVKRKITVGANPGFKFLARIKRNKAIGFDKLASRIQKNSSITKADAYAAMLQMEEEAIEELLEGNPVQLGRLGTIHPEFKAKAVNTLEEVDESTIVLKRFRFIPSKELREMAKKIPVELDKSDRIKGLQSSKNL